MRHISETVYGMLMSQAIANAKPVGAGKVRGKVAQPIGVGAASVKGPDPKARPVYREVGKPNQAGEKPQGCAFRVHTNPDLSGMLKRGRTHPRERLPTFGVRPRLNIIQGGRN